MLRIVVVHGTDPNNGNTWSGTPKRIIDVLRGLGHTVATVGPLPPVETCWRNIQRWCYRHVLGKDYLAIRDPSALRTRARVVSTLVGAQSPFDAVVVLHAADAAILKTAAPLIYIHDATWHELLDFYPRYARRRLAEVTIAGGYALDRLALANCDRAIFSSRWAADSVRRQYGIGDDKLRVHPFGPNLAVIPSEDELRQAIARRGQAPCRVLFVGADWLRKGGDKAVAVAQHLNQRTPPVELQIVGCDPPADTPGWVRRFGYLSRENAGAHARLAQLFLEADFFLLPTRADCSPIVLNEAAASGLPVATAAVGAIPEIMGSGSWGVALPPDAGASAYADWIEATRADRNAYERLAWQARREFQERLNWTAFGRMLIATITEAHQAGARCQRDVATPTQ
jgi:glycosyltransferase involved in cell wall biosynthesis